MKPGFYNNNLSRFYPFIVRDEVRLPNYAIVGFGSTMLAGTEYVEGTDTVTLKCIRLVGDDFEFIFECSADGLDGKQLIFQRSVTDADYYTQFTREQDSLTDEDIEDDSTPAHVAPEDDPDVCGDDPIWEGFLVTGDLSDLKAWLNANHSIGDMAVYQPDAEDRETVEPALIQNLADQQIRKIGIANKERTRSERSSDCRPYCWPFTLDDVYVVRDCLDGHVRVEDGFNIAWQQSALDNSLTIDARVGSGLGEVYDELPVFPGEEAPIGASTLSGSLLCCEVVRSVNGVGNRVFQLEEGPGTRITSIPEQNRVIVDIDLNSLAICPDFGDDEPVYCIYPNEDECECGPLDIGDFVCPDGSYVTTSSTTDPPTTSSTTEPPTTTTEPPTTTTTTETTTTQPPTTTTTTETTTTEPPTTTTTTETTTPPVTSTTTTQTTTTEPPTSTTTTETSTTPTPTSTTTTVTSPPCASSQATYTWTGVSWDLTIPCPGGCSSVPPVLPGTTPGDTTNTACT